MKQEWWSGQTRFGVKPGLERIQALLARLGHPERRLPIVHVAGTNGKGSVAAMVAHVLRSQGWRVGLYVSPDMGRVNERIWINGEPLAADEWDHWAHEIEDKGQGLVDVPTWFETITALAFLSFAEHPVDVAVVEVGLGGRLDATNVVPAPLLSIITPVALDHTRFLGSTIEAIAREKAGIIKSGSELVLARQPFPEARSVIWDAAHEQRVPVWEPDTSAILTPRGPELTTRDGLIVSTGLLGAYQTGNLDTAWCAVERLATRGWITDVRHAASALKTVRWSGRFQVISQEPLIVVDGAHNPHGMYGVADTLARTPWHHRNWHVVFGVLGDKAAPEMLSALMPRVQSVVLTRVPGERGADPNSLAVLVPDERLAGIVDDPADAVRLASGRLQSTHDAMLVTGSLALLAYLRQNGFFETPSAFLSIVDEKN